MINNLKRLKGVYFPNKNPNKKGPYGDKNDYRELSIQAQQIDTTLVDNFCNKLGYSIDLNYFENLALYTQVVKKNSPLNYQHGKVLYSLLSKYISENSNLKNIHILETGTARGFSSICMSKALNDRNIEGTIFTIDFLPHEKAIYWNCISDFEGKKSRKDLLNQWKKERDNIEFLTGKTSKILKNLKIERINFAFLDGAHLEKAVLKEYNFIFPKQVQGDIIVFDDVNKNIFPGVYEAIKQIQKSKVYSFEFMNLDENRKIAIATRNKGIKD